ncbi:MAG TPA: hypothetical protein PLX03_10525, partial [Candidatus Hydrogenedentes bacterium]|nr:hypothetical protein [Candidatus Hydrogenedentota bacterium]
TVRARPGNAEKVYAMLSTLWSRFLFHGAVAAADLHNAAEFRVFNGKDIPETASVAAWICGPSGCFPPVSAFDGLSQLLDAAGVPKMKRGG